MQAIKALVVFMGVLLVAGIALLGYGMYSKAGRLAKPQDDVAAVAVMAPAQSMATFGEIVVSQPAGTSIEAVQAMGGQLILTLRGGGVADRLLVIDTASKAVVGSVLLDSEAAVQHPAASPQGSGEVAPPIR
jgi:hypothetical protein